MPVLLMAKQLVGNYCKKFTSVAFLYLFYEKRAKIYTNKKNWRLISICSAAHNIACKVIEKKMFFFAIFDWSSLMTS